jgi:hypothetical protein
LIPSNLWFIGILRSLSLAKFYPYPNCLYAAELKAS